MSAKPSAAAASLYPDFDGAFYLQANPDVRAAGVDALEHYVRSGKAEGRSAQLPMRVFPLLISDGWKDTEAVAVGICHQRQWRAFLPATTGKSPPPRIYPGFDDAYYLESNPDVRDAGIDPYEHYVRIGRAEGRPANPPLHVFPLAITFAADEGVPVEPVGLQPIGESMPADAQSEADDSRIAAEFDALFYLDSNSDVRESGVDPYEHYRRSGRLEGRPGRPVRTDFRDGQNAPDASRKSVLVVLGDASLSPSRAGDLAFLREFEKRFNVFVLLLGAAQLEEPLRQVPTSVTGPVFAEDNSRRAARVLTDLCAGQAFEFALVDGMDARMALQRLTELSIPTLLLIDELEDGATSSEAFSIVLQWSMQIVFPCNASMDKALQDCPQRVRKFCHVVGSHSPARSGATLALASVDGSVGDIDIAEKYDADAPQVDGADARRYSDQLLDCAREAMHRLAAEIESAEHILSLGSLSSEVFPRMPDRHASPDYRVLHDYVRSWSTGIGNRKPCPAFDPGIYRDANGSDLGWADPYACYLLGGSPAGPWKVEAATL